MESNMTIGECEEGDGDLDCDRLELDTLGEVGDRDGDGDGDADLDLLDEDEVNLDLHFFFIFGY
jgi:hypothetical protein